MLAGAAELGLVRGKLKSEYWKLAMPLAFAVSGAAFLIHEAEPVALRALGVRAPRRAAGRCSSARCSRSAPRSSRARSSSTPGSRSCSSRVAVALFSSRDVAPIFGHLVAARPGCRTDEARSLVGRCSSRSRSPARRSAHATLRADHAVRRPAARRASPREVRLEFDQSVRALSNAIQVFDAKGRLVSGVPHVAGRQPARRRRARARAAAWRRTRSAGRRSRTTATSVAACSRSASG